MRIAIINWSRRKVGGVESYLSNIIPELLRVGHEIAFWHEVDMPLNRPQISLPEISPVWCAAEMGVRSSLEALRKWQPDLIYTHKMEDPELEAEIMQFAPSVYFAHDYQGTCISGLKAFKSPVSRPCSRRFGWQCLLHYYPRRCGGLNPFTMMTLYRLQSKRLVNLRGYDAIVTHSDHMLAELINHGLSPKRAYNFPYYVKPLPELDPSNIEQGQPAPQTSSGDDCETLSVRQERKSWQLLFTGRMEFLKGAHYFLQALPQAAAMLKMPLHVMFAGEGRERETLEHQAAQLQAQSPNVSIDFLGWLAHEEMDALFNQCDLMVVPSLWPEPFGLVGPEAGLHGVPVVAYAVGGIPDWLVNGVNGYLAPADPPTPAGLAQAIVRCLNDLRTYARLRRGAIEVAARFNIKNHMASLLKVFEEVISSR